ncbi:Hypothetical protein NTJ_16183 [Nesidiocoris tenuis]|nr:Hypothetical protein NTJ_16183 [Nesidiocoris tenuis]
MSRFLLFCALLSPALASSDPWEDGYIIDGYLDNVKDIIQRHDAATVKLPDFHLFPDSFWSFSGRDGYFKDLLKLYRVNEAELTSLGNTTNLKAGFYLSNAHLHYRFTLSTVEFDVDLKFFQNLFNVNVNYTAEHPCTIEYAPDSIDVSLLGGSDVTVRVDALHNNIVPEYVRDFVESTVQFGVESTINTGLVLLATRMALSSYVVTFLTENTGKIDVCDVFRSVTSQ